MSAPPVEAAAPNWAEIATEPQCPLCEYMLRGLTTPRCPECGYTFSWHEVLEISIREHPYLFEHHPERNTWSYFKTTIGALRPRRFWLQLHPSQYGSFSRLVAYWLITTLICGTVLAFQPLFRILFRVVFHNYLIPSQHANTPTWKDVVPTAYDAYFMSGILADLMFGVVLLGVWPWLTFLTLQVYGISMRKARIRPVHVLRCVHYSFDSTFVIIAILLSAIHIECSLLYVSPWGYYSAGYWSSRWDIVALWIVAVHCLHAYRLNIAYRLYLQMAHPEFVAISSQVITILTIFTILVLLHLA